MKRLVVPAVGIIAAFCFYKLADWVFNRVTRWWFARKYYRIITSKKREQTC